MVKLIALYRHPENQEEFDKRYFEEHLPLSDQMPGLRKVEIAKVIGSPMGNKEYYLQAELYFNDMDSLKAAMKSEESKAAGKVLMGFAGELVTMYFAEIVER